VPSLPGKGGVNHWGSVWTGGFDACEKKKRISKGRAFLQAKGEAKGGEGLAGLAKKKRRRGFVDRKKEKQCLGKRRLVNSARKEDCPGIFKKF